MKKSKSRKQKEACFAIIQRYEQALEAFEVSEHTVIYKS